jgi:hypothetical protein
MGPLHLPAHTDQVPHHNRNSQGNITSRSPPLLPTEMVSRRGTPKKGTTLKTPLRHVHSGTRFSPWKLVLQGRVNPQWCPQQGERRPKGATTIATDSGDFHSQYHLCCTFSTTPLPGEARYSLRHHHGTTSMHLPTPPPDQSGADQHHRRGGEKEHHPLKTSIACTEEPPDPLASSRKARSRQAQGFRCGRQCTASARAVGGHHPLPSHPDRHRRQNMRPQQSAGHSPCHPPVRAPAARPPDPAGSALDLEAQATAAA